MQSECLYFFIFFFDGKAGADRPHPRQCAMEPSYWDPDSPLWAKYDLGFYRTRFMEDSTRIFSSDKDELEILRSNCWRETEDTGEDSGTENDPGVRIGATWLEDHS